MATLAEVESLRTVLDDVATLAQRDVNDIFYQLVNGLELTPDLMQDVMRDVLPGVINPYAATAANLSTEFYFADREAARVGSYYSRPPGAALPAQQAIRSLAGYGTQALINNPAATGLALALVAGGMQRLLFNVQRNTMFKLADSDPAQPRYQRMTTSAEPCEFCIMLASRGAVYESEGSAGAVVGRGVPLGQNKGSSTGGRIGKGIRPRGPKLIGERYHDNDRCVAVAVHSGRRQEMDRAAVGHFELYAEARARLEPRNLKYNTYKLPDGSLKRMYRWEDDAGHIVTNDDRVKQMMKLMREIRKESPLSRI